MRPKLSIRMLESLRSEFVLAGAEAANDATARTADKAHTCLRTSIFWIPIFAEISFRGVRPKKLPHMSARLTRSLHLNNLPSESSNDKRFLTSSARTRERRNQIGPLFSQPHTPIPDGVRGDMGAAPKSPWGLPHVPPDSIWNWRWFLDSFKKLALTTVSRSQAGAMRRRRRWLACPPESNSQERLSSAVPLRCFVSPAACPTSAARCNSATVPQSAEYLRRP